MTRQQNKDPIAYQNKDITAKVLAENFKGKSLEAYGLHLPRVVDVRPTNLPAIEAKELRLDNIFILEDASWAIIDYESEYREKNKIKYLGYVAQLAKRMYNNDQKTHLIRIIVIYTADVKRGTTDPILDMGANRLQIEEAFLSDLDSEKIRERISGKLDRKEPLDDIDLMQLIIYPQTYGGKKAKQKAISEAIDLAVKIEDEEKKRFTLAAINVFSDKIITETDRERIRRMFEMTKLGKEFWEDAFNSGVKQGTEQGRMNERVQIARNLLRKGDDVETVSECTGLSPEEVRALEAELLQKA